MSIAIAGGDSSSENSWHLQTLNVGFDQHLQVGPSFEPPQRPSNAGAYLLMFLGVCGLLLALFVGANERGAEGFAVALGVVGLLFLLGGIGAKKPADQLANAQASWDRR